MESVSRQAELLGGLRQRELEWVTDAASTKARIGRSTDVHESGTTGFRG